MILGNARGTFFIKNGVLNKKVDMFEKFLEKYNLIQKFKEFLKTNPIRFIQEHRGQYNERNKVEMIVSQKNSEIGR